MTPIHPLKGVLPRANTMEKEAKMKSSTTMSLSRRPRRVRVYRHEATLPSCATLRSSSEEEEEELGGFTGVVEEAAGAAVPVVGVRAAR